MFCCQIHHFICTAISRVSYIACIWFMLGLAELLAIRKDDVVVQQAQSQQRRRNFDGKETDDDYVISS